MDKDVLLNLLVRETAPSLGVTEPGAVALACAAASDNNRIDTHTIKLKASPNIFKNCMAVGIPGIDVKGILAAAALGALGGDQRKGLEALSSVTPEASEAGRRMLARKGVSVELSRNGELLYLEAICRGTAGAGRCIIQGSHDRIAYLERNGEVLVNEWNGSSDQAAQFAIPDDFRVSDLVEVLKETSADDLAFLCEAVGMNTAAAQWGLEHRPGMAVGASLHALAMRGILPPSLVADLMVHTAAASDVRVSGSPVPVMTCTGSGNHGITAIVPLARAAGWLGCSEAQKLRAVALSIAVTAFIKHHSGKLSGMCGCGVASATGVACGLTFLQGGTVPQIEASIKNMAGNLTGMICDGAKEGCSVKLATAVFSAAMASALAMESVAIPDGNGIVTVSCEQTMVNMGTVSSRGMTGTDEVILGIMREGL